ncbi:chitin synthase [Synchytrium microbalum]|uniref:chitin synthase n=1 Tax=Synchytrium microbalum TaxID=1806994 RepID=A0A507CDB3_9FUNG|nr:chitin synthase [Synchytrium microbalum]TPX36036.1 chitin synthase [Synchytrium microbalum]
MAKAPKVPEVAAKPTKTRANKKNKATTNGIESLPPTYLAPALQDLEYGTSLRSRSTVNKLDRSASRKRVKPLMRRASAAPPLARAGMFCVFVLNLRATSTRHEGWEADGSGTLHRTHKTLKQQAVSKKSRRRPYNCWAAFAMMLTCCFPPYLLAACGKRNASVRQAWREKIALCLIILFMCLMVGFITYFLRSLLCPTGGYDDVMPVFNQSYKWPRPMPSFGGDMIINGFLYDFDNISATLGAYYGFTDEWRGADITKLFPPKPDHCQQFLGYTSYDCTMLGPHGGPALPANGQDCPNMAYLRGVPQMYRLWFSWDDIRQSTTYPHLLTVFDGKVLNLTGYFYGANGLQGRFLDTLGYRIASIKVNETIGKDGTKSFFSNSESYEAGMCFSQRYLVGYVDNTTAGCFFSQVIMILIIAVVGTLMLIRVTMAFMFYWVMSRGLTKSRDPKEKWSATDAVNLRLNNKRGPPDDLRTVLLMTCYSEGREAISRSIGALVNSTYDDKKKLLFVVCDGVITGSGNKQSTPELVLSLMEQDEELGKVEHKAYIAIGDGSKQFNMAKVFGGWCRTKKGGKVATIVVVKTGAPAERSEKKAGNRGKRDSQLIVMNFLSRAVLDDRMTPLDYDMFWKIEKLTNYTADKFESILMVDADTEVKPDALQYLTNALKNDLSIMGLCGETRIANKGQSWVTLIQVFEYYISHHLGKGFESVFGGVSCLPGCFCMYRIKVPKGPQGYFVPLLVNPDIVEEYSENVVDTLHKKNLLLLGEDRFLTTLMLRNFPKRKTVFVPQAVCHTTVPDKFRVLLSQRRRWINSTIHNLLELILVKDLCGIFCFSMQFVVFLELVSTAVLPAAVVFTVLLIVNNIISGKPDWFTVAMIAGTMLLPAILILITTRKVRYLGYMVFYILAIPIWNFILPAYAWWHFDDFSWGSTRVVEGDAKGAHDESKGVFNPRKIQLKTWDEWEKDRLKAMRGDVDETVGQAYDPYGWTTFADPYYGWHYYGGGADVYSNTYYAVPPPVPFGGSEWEVKNQYDPVLGGGDPQYGQNMYSQNPPYSPPQSFIQDRQYELYSQPQPFIQDPYSQTQPFIQNPYAQDYIGQGQMYGNQAAAYTNTYPGAGIYDAYASYPSHGRDKMSTGSRHGNNTRGRSLPRADGNSSGSQPRGRSRSKESKVPTGERGRSASKSSPKDRKGGA